jgi:Helix-turn-helix domain
MEGDYFTAEEAASYLRLAPATLANWRSSGDGPLYLKLGAKVVYRRRDLDAWADAHRRDSTNNPGAEPHR